MKPQTRVEALETRTTDAQELDRLIETIRLDEHRGHAEAVRALQEKWEMQREALERRATDAEDRAQRVRKDAEVRLAALQLELKGVRESLSKAMTPSRPGL